jgi:hypothetical protein
MSICDERIGLPSPSRISLPIGCQPRKPSASKAPLRPKSAAEACPMLPFDDQPDARCPPPVVALGEKVVDVLGIEGDDAAKGTRPVTRRAAPPHDLHPLDDVGVDEEAAAVGVVEVHPAAVEAQHDLVVGEAADVRLLRDRRGPPTIEQRPHVARRRGDGDLVEHEALVLARPCRKRGSQSGQSRNHVVPTAIMSSGTSWLRLSDPAPNPIGFPTKAVKYRRTVPCAPSRPHSGGDAPATHAVSFSIDLEGRTLQTIDNPFGSRLSPM